MKSKLLSYDLNFLEITLICIERTGFGILLKPFLIILTSPGRGELGTRAPLITTASGDPSCHPRGERHVRGWETVCLGSERLPKIVPRPRSASRTSRNRADALLLAARTVPWRGAQRLSAVPRAPVRCFGREKRRFPQTRVCTLLLPAAARLERFQLLR